MTQRSSRVKDRPPHSVPCDRRRSILIEFRLVVSLLQLASGLLQVLRGQIQVAHTVRRTSDSNSERSDGSQITYDPQPANCQS